VGTGRPEESGPTRPVGRSPAIHSSPPHATDSPRPRSEPPAFRQPLRLAPQPRPRCADPPLPRRASSPAPIPVPFPRGTVEISSLSAGPRQTTCGRTPGGALARSRPVPAARLWTWDVAVARQPSGVGRASLRNDGLGPRQGTRDCALGTSAAVLRTRLVAATQPKEDGPPGGIPLRWGSPPGGISADGSQPRDQLNRWSDDGPRTAIAARWAGVP